MSEDKVNFMIGTKVGEPVPTKDAFDADDNVFDEGEDQFEEQFGIGLDILVEEHRSFMVQYADVHFPGM